MSNKLEFSTNWNGKLHTVVFSTLRATARFEIGDRVEVMLEGKYLGLAECIYKHRYSHIYEIPEALCFLDTGYNQEETGNIVARMYKTAATNQPLYYYLFKWIQTANAKKDLKRQVQLEFSLPGNDY